MAGSRANRRERCGGPQAGVIHMVQGGSEVVASSAGSQRWVQGRSDLLSAAAFESLPIAASRMRTQGGKVSIVICFNLFVRYEATGPQVT